MIDPTVGGLVVLGVIAAGLLWRRAVTATTAADNGSDADDGDHSAGDSEDASVWNAIPPWQYGGRHVESGGLARGEQEQALQDIQQQADELSDDPAQNEP